MHGAALPLITPPTVPTVRRRAEALVSAPRSVDGAAVLTATLRKRFNASHRYFQWRGRLAAGAQGGIDFVRHRAAAPAGEPGSCASRRS